MAVKETIVLDAQLNSSQAESSVKSLKSQLREAQAEVAKLSEQFGATSVQAREAAKKAAELKDAIGDAKALTDAFNPDRKFNALGSALSGVAGGFAAIQGAMALVGTESKDIEKTLLKVQAAMALAQGINAITESTEAFKNLKSVAIDAFNGIKKAIGSTGIGLIVVALGTIYAYWDDIKEAVSGVSAEQQKLLTQSKKQLEIEKLKLSDLNHQDETLKRQGLSEKQISLQKVKQLNTIIAQAEANIKGEEAAQKLREKNAERNYEITKNLIRGAQEVATVALRVLAAPLDLLITTANKASKILGFGEITAFNINDEITKLNKNISEYTATYLFDPKKVKDDGEKASREANSALIELKNQRDGYLNKIDEMDNKSAQTKEKNNQKEEDDSKRLNAELLKNQQENTLLRIEDERKRAMLKLEIDLENQKKEIENSKASTELKNKNIAALEEQYMLQLQDLKDKYAQEDKKKAEEERKKAEEEAKRLLELQLKAEKENDEIVNNARLARIKDAAVKRQEEEAIRYQKEIDTLYTLLNNKEITEADFNARREAMKALHEAKLTEIEKQNKEERIKIAEAEYQSKLSIYNSMGSALGALSDAIGKNTKMGKAMAVAQVAIDTGVAISGIVRQASKNPTNLTPFQLVADIAIRTAAVIANIKKAKEMLSSAKVGGGDGGGVPSPAAAPIAPQMSSTAMNQAMINQMGNATNRAFVLESDVSGNQERIRRLNRAARIN